MAGRLIPALVFAWLVSGTPAHGSGPPERPVSKPVRSSTSWGKALIEEGCRRSAVLEQIVCSLGTRKVVVYVQPANHLPQSTEGYLFFVGESGGYRYMRVALKPGLPRHQLIALLAHELQHAREVAEAAEVVDQQSFSDLFRRIGNPSHGGFDTAAARLVGLRVSHELEGR